MTFRDKAPQYSTDGNAYVLTIKDLLSKAALDISNLPTAEVDESSLHNCLLPGEVLLPGRGDHYKARHFRGAKMPVFPAGQINVLRLEPEINSEYLTWYLNQEEAQRFISNSLGGTGIKALSKTRLLMMPIPLAPLDIQRRIESLQKLQEVRSSILMELDDLNQREINASCAALLNLNNA